MVAHRNCLICVCTTVQVRSLLIDPAWLEVKLHCYGVAVVVDDFRSYLQVSRLTHVLYLLLSVCIASKPHATQNKHTRCRAMSLSCHVVLCDISHLVTLTNRMSHIPSHTGGNGPPGQGSTSSLPDEPLLLHGAQPPPHDAQPAGLTADGSSTGGSHNSTQHIPRNAPHCCHQPSQQQHAAQH